MHVHVHVHVYSVPKYEHATEVSLYVVSALYRL